MNKNFTGPILAGFGLLSLSIALPLSLANAQQAGPTRAVPPPQQRDLPPDFVQQPERVRQGFPGQQPGQGFQPGQGPIGGGMQMMGGGPATMIDDQENIYILRGNQLFKVRKSDLRVVAQGELPFQGPRPMPAPGVEGAPTRPERGQRGGGFAPGGAPGGEPTPSG